MKWTPKVRPNEGATRIKSWFAWLPVQTIKNKEIRWLEKVHCEQELKRCVSYDYEAGLGTFEVTDLKWVNIRFLSARGECE